MAYVNAEWGKKVESLGPESDPALFDEKRAAPMRLIKREIVLLERRKPELDPILEADRAQASARVLIDSSLEGMRFLRYERTTSMELHRSIRQLHGLPGTTRRRA